MVTYRISTPNNDDIEIIVCDDNSILIQEGDNKITMTKSILRMFNLLIFPEDRRTLDLSVEAISKLLMERSS